jgi:hypothetical protein
MARGRRKRRSSAGRGTLAELRKQAQTVMKRLQRAGRAQLSALESQIAGLNRQRQKLLDEIGSALGGTRGGGRRGRPPGAARGGRRGRRSRVDWDSVFSRLPKGSFRASDVRKIVPGVAAGTLSQRLTGWVNDKKLKRTGSRRGTRYTKA